jgi:hypothetical protein
LGGERDSECAREGDARDRKTNENPVGKNKENETEREKKEHPMAQQQQRHTKKIEEKKKMEGKKKGSRQRNSRCMRELVSKKTVHTPAFDQVLDSDQFVDQFVACANIKERTHELVTTLRM